MITDDGKRKAGDDVEYPPSLRNRPRCDQPGTSRLKEKREASATLKFSLGRPYEASPKVKTERSPRTQDMAVEMDPSEASIGGV